MRVKQHVVQQLKEEGNGMEKLTFIGAGYVGLVTGTCFADTGQQVVVCDIDQSKIDRLKRGIMSIHEPGLAEMAARNIESGRLSFTTNLHQAVREATIVFIAVGTPMSGNGEADLSYVREAAKMIGDAMNGPKIIVVKSTVPIGTARLIETIIRTRLSNPTLVFDVVSNPEFLRQGTAISDCFQMERAVIGSIRQEAADAVAKLHKPFTNRILLTDPETAETIKYASNAFLATKISFLNEIANLCEHTGADITKVAEGMGYDSRIGSRFLQAGIGYGGSCFPKDTEALRHMAQRYGSDFSLLSSVIETNLKQRIRFVEKVERTFGKLNGKKIAVLGLSFKPETDDMRFAPSLDIVPQLLERGAVLKLYDPAAITNAKAIFGACPSYGDDLYETIAGCDGCVVLTEWRQIIDMDLDKVKRLLHSSIVVDGRNCFRPEAMRSAGLRYVSVGRPEASLEQMALGGAT